MSLTNQANLAGCCTGLQRYTPAEIENRTGLSAIVYRTGTHARFKATMQARLSSAALPELRNLTTRDDDDLTNALIDAWAAVLDVLTFYSERQASEHYLLTATERRSLKWLAELIGYWPRPGLAAEAYLAFTVDDAQGAPQVTTVSAGTPVQSIPKPGELPQIFETAADQEVRAAWNAMTPRRFYPQTLSTDTAQVLLEGNYASVRPGARMLVVDNNDVYSFKTVARVYFDGQKNQTLIDFAKGVTGLTPVISSTSATALDYASYQPIDSVAGTFSGNEVSWADSYAYFTYNFFNIAQIASIFQSNISLQEQPGDTELAPAHGLFLFKQRAAIFGHNAPDWDMLPLPDGAEDKDDAYGPNWNNYNLVYNDTPTGPHIFLDQVYDDILPDSWVVVTSPDTEPKAQRVASMVEQSRSQFTLNAKVSRVTLYELPVAVQAISMRNATVHCASEPVPLALVEDTSFIAGNAIILADFYPDLTPGQQVIVTGQVPALGNLVVHERVEISEVLTVDFRTKLIFKDNLENEYTRETVTLNANVIQATHGETHEATLGNGQADHAFQTLPLQHQPLTYLADPTSDDGAASTLEVRVDQVAWAEVRSFFEQAANARAYITRQDEDGLTHVMFGNGENGRRPSTGLENITAQYRSGLGLAGNVDSDQLALLLQKPHGVRSVTNPLPASGGADPDAAEDIRQNATMGMRTLDRIVSLQDFEDYARSYNGITKAQAAWAWAGESQGVFITVGGQTEDPVNANILDNLRTTIRRNGDPLVPLVIQSHLPRHFQIDALVFYNADYSLEVLEQAIRDKLRETFSYEQAQFGRNIAINDVIGLIQAIEGVIAVDLNALNFINEAAKPNPVLEAHVPSQGEDLSDLDPATLLLLTPEPTMLTFTAVKQEGS